MRRIVVQGVSGSGKTTVGRELARRLGFPFLELDAVVHGPGWVDRSQGEVREAIGPLLAEEAWVVDGDYRGLLGDLVVGRADTLVWLDVPIRTWLPRLTYRTARRLFTGEELWNGNRERLRNLLERPNIFEWAFRKHFRERAELPSRIAAHGHLELVRLSSARAVGAFLASVDDGRTR